ncbi:MAG: aldehyde reductase [Pseudomonadota bacterium]
MTSSSAPIVLVTGASGFIAMHCIQQLLSNGYGVRGTLRSMERVDEIRKAVGDSAAAIEFFEADLEHDAGWREATTGAAYVLHVASPFPAEQPDDPDVLVQPARDGTLRVLNAARSSGVRRVVMTSSMAAVMADRGKSAGHIYTEADWTDITDKHVTPYEKSKTIAEQAAWDFVKDKGGPELVTILPGGVLGPILSPDYSASADLVRLLMERAMPACPRLGFNLIDVRDVAAAHIAAMTADNARGERFVCAIEPIWLKEIAAILKNKYSDSGWKIPTGGLPDSLVKIGALFDPTLKRISPFLGRRSEVDYSKLKTHLGLSPRRNGEMIIAMADSLISHGVVNKPNT